MGAAHQPAVHHGVGDFWMELQRITGAGTKRLNLEGLALGQQLALGRQLKALAVPLIDVVWPFSADGATGFGRADRIVADLGMTLRMRIDAGAEMTRHHLDRKSTRL